MTLGKRPIPRGTDDIGYLINLACIAHTGVRDDNGKLIQWGSPLPCNDTDITSWSYSIQSYSNCGPRKYAKFNLMSSPYLRNPFSTAGDPYPIEHTIKRSIINDSIISIFNNCSKLDINNACLGKDQDALTIGEASILRTAYIQTHQGPRVSSSVWGILEKPEINELGRYRERENTELLLMFILATLSPYQSLPDTPKGRLYQKIFMDTTDKSDIAIITKIRRSAEKNFNRRSAAWPHDGGLRLTTRVLEPGFRTNWGATITIPAISTGSGNPTTKHADWYPWFVLAIAYGSLYATNITEQLAHAHNRRSRRVGSDWWKFVREYSGEYDRHLFSKDYKQLKNYHDERVVNNIISCA